MALVTDEQWAEQRAQIQEDKSKRGRELYQKFAEVLGLNLKWLGKTFSDGRHKYEILGLDSANLDKKHIVLVRNEGGTEYLYPVDTIAAQMSKNPAAAVKALQDQRDAKVRKDAKEHLNRWGDLYGYPAYGTKFKHKGMTYTVIGSKKARSCPIVTETENGKLWFFSVFLMNEILKTQK